MDDEYIKRFNDSRTFLYLAGYITEAENEKIKQRFTKAAEKKGVKLIRQPLLMQAG